MSWLGLLYSWLGLKNKRFVCPFGLKNGRVGSVGQSFFFSFNLGTEEQAFISNNSRSSVDPSVEFTKELNKELYLYTAV